MNDDAATGRKVTSKSQENMATNEEPFVMEPGRCYKGSAMINEDGDLEFHRYRNTGKKGHSPFRAISGADDECPIQLKKSKTHVRMILTVDLLQGDKDRENEFRELFVRALEKLKKYDV